MLFTILASISAQLNQAFRAQYSNVLRKREQARQKRLGRNIDLYI